MVNVRTTTVVINGAAAEASQQVAIADNNRKYIALYAKTGSCKVSLGDVTHANAFLVIGAGNYFETDVNFQGAIHYSTTDTVLHVIQDINSSVCLTSDNLILTSDGYNMTYNIDLSTSSLSSPVFS